MKLRASHDFKYHNRDVKSGLSVGQGKSLAGMHYDAHPNSCLFVTKFLASLTILVFLKNGGTNIYISRRSPVIRRPTHRSIYWTPSANRGKTQLSLTMSTILGRFQPSHGSAASINPNPTSRASVNDPNLLDHAPTGTDGRREKRSRRDLEAAEDEFQGWVDPYGPAPTVKQWFKLYWHDLLA